jgi:hypothetical protein
MRRGLWMSSAALVASLAVAVPVAGAQDTEVGGSVPSFMGLALDEAEGFATFPPGPGSHELRIRARVTLTAGRATLSVADGDVMSGPRLGRMASDVGMLQQPLEATVSAPAFQPLDLAIEPPLAAFRSPVANVAATVRLRQRIEEGESPQGTFAKTILITLSSSAP